MRNLKVEDFEDITTQYVVHAPVVEAMNTSEVWFRVEWSGVFMGRAIRDAGYYTADFMQRSILPWVKAHGFDWAAQRVY